LFVVVGRIAPTKCDRAVRKRDQAMVGDSYAMGVMAQITEHMLRTSERWFRVDHPILSKEWSQPGRKDFGLSEGLQVSVKTEPAVLKSALECGDELAAKDSAWQVREST
jgi:hypothetical protein